MPNKFKLNPSGGEVNSLFRNGWAIDVTTNNTGGGPSASTRFYNGVIIPSGGYAIYKPDGTVFTALNDTQLLEFVGSSSGDTSNIQNAIAWASENGYLVLDKNFDEISTDGLIVMLDGTNSASWDGRTWRDMSGAGNNATVDVGVISKGEIGLNFNGSSSLYINKSGNMDTWANNQTVAIWMKHNFTSGRRNPWNQAYGGYGTWTHEAGNNINCYFGDAGSNASPYTSGNSGTTSRDVWNFAVTSRDTSKMEWYINGDLRSTRTHSYGTLTNTSAGVNIGRGYAGYWIGEMGMVMAWDRKLSQDEIISVYNATSGKFA